MARKKKVVNSSLSISSVNFPEKATTALPVYYRTYARQKNETRRETKEEGFSRSYDGLIELGNFTEEQKQLIKTNMAEAKVFPSGRWLWVGGTDFVKVPENYFSAYNCCNILIESLEDLGHNFNLLMQGSGVGAILEKENISKLPTIINKINLKIVGDHGLVEESKRKEHTAGFWDSKNFEHGIIVGDSRQGWVDTYLFLLRVATGSLAGFSDYSAESNVTIDISNIRPAGTPIKGFGGVTNPSGFVPLLERVVEICNGAFGRKLRPLEVSFLLNEAAKCTVAGNVRRCLPEGTLVFTQNGLIPIQDVKLGTNVYTSKGIQKVTATFDQGTQTIARIETDANPVFATPNHKVAVLTDPFGGYTWKKIEELKQGDRLAHFLGEVEGTPQHMPSKDDSPRPAHSTTCKDFEVPELTEEVAWFIGYFHGNGYVNAVNKSGFQLSISLSSEYPEELVSRLEDGFRLFGEKTIKTIKVPGENTTNVRVYNTRLGEYFFEHIKQSNTTLKVPRWILENKASIRAAYLAGLMDSDGAHNNRPPHLLTTVYRPFAEEVAALYASLGIPSRLSIMIPKEENWKPKYNILLIGFRDKYNALIAPFSTKGNLKDKRRQHGYLVPRDFIKGNFSPKLWRKVWCYSPKGMNFETFQETLGSPLPYVPVTVKSVDLNFEERKTYDIEVENDHEFFANGYLTHNSARIDQFSSDDEEAAFAKLNLWTQDEDGNWKVDQGKDALRMANFTRIYHEVPSLEELEKAIELQTQSGEGAIMYAPNALKRTNNDLSNFRTACISSKEKNHRMSRIGLNPCGEILGSNFLCNLSEVHLNQLDPNNLEEQKEVFTVAGLIAASLLVHQFPIEKFKYSRELDPIVGVSFTGAFDFFVNLFGSDWLLWWAEGRPEIWSSSEYSTSAKMPQSEYFKKTEREYLQYWRSCVEISVKEYCEANNLKVPNRCTTVQPAGTKSLLTGASFGWHPPKAQRYIRRVTFAKNDPVALACLKYGYPVVPSQSDKDENGNLLVDPFDPRCTEWLVEMPIEVSWADQADKTGVDIGKLPVLAQFDFYMQVQTYYVGHNTSGTLEVSPDEITSLAKALQEAIKEGEFVTVAMLGRSKGNTSFPRLPFEPISKEVYDELMKGVLERRGKNNNFYQLLEEADFENALGSLEGPAQCDSDKCLF